MIIQKKVTYLTNIINVPHSSRRLNSVKSCEVTNNGSYNKYNNEKIDRKQ